MGPPVGKALVVAGLLLAAAGLLLMGLSRSGGRWLGHLPLDLRLQKGDTTIWLPVGTMLLLSLLLTLLLNLFLWLRR